MARKLFGIALVLVAACGNKAKEAPGAARFAPSDADTVIRLDLTRAKAWAGWAKAAPLAFRAVQPAVDAVKAGCGLDLIGEASSILLARRGVGASGDLTLAIGGLPKDKVSACMVKLGTTMPGVEIVPDGDRFMVKRGDKGFASGAMLPGGELVIVSRGASSIEPAAWRQEVTSGSGAPPAWWAELDQTQPVAVRMQSKEHTIHASVELADPFVIRGKVVAADAQAAELDHARLKAMVDFLTKADAGTGRLEPKDNVVHGDFTATGPQIDRLVAAGLSALGGDQPEPAPPPPMPGNTTPIECKALDAAVATYMATSLERMAPDQRQLIEPTIQKLITSLQAAYADACTQDKWGPEVIHCHVDQAAQLSRFEKCRMLLAEDQRKRFDTLVKAALDAAR